MSWWQIRSRREANREQDRGGPGAGQRWTGSRTEVDREQEKQTEDRIGKAGGTQEQTGRIGDRPGGSGTDRADKQQAGKRRKLIGECQEQIGECQKLIGECQKLIGR